MMPIPILIGGEYTPFMAGMMLCGYMVLLWGMSYFGAINGYEKRYFSFGTLVRCIVIVGMNMGIFMIVGIKSFILLLIFIVTQISVYLIVLLILYAQYQKEQKRLRQEEHERYLKDKAENDRIFKLWEDAGSPDVPYSYQSMTTTTTPIYMQWYNKNKKNNDEG